MRNDIWKTKVEAEVKVEEDEVLFRRSTST
jgi:hypothetical protein